MPWVASDANRPGPLLRLALLLLVAAVPSAQAQLLPRVGVGGALRLGFGGALARAGIPFDYLTVTEQCDPASLARYDLVLMADLVDRYEPWRADAMLALDSYLANGGRLLCQPGTQLPRAMAGWRVTQHWPPAWPPVTEARDFALVAGHHPFLDRFPPRRRWQFTGRIGTMDLPQATDGQVLARFVGPAASGPAIVARVCGPGRLLYIGADIAYMQGNWTAAYDDLILGAVGYLSDGRLAPQWEPAPPPSIPAEEPPSEPPGAPARPGEVDLGGSSPDGYAILIEAGLRRLPCRLALERFDGQEIRIDLSAESAAVALPGGITHRYALPRQGDVVLERTPTDLRLAVQGAVRQRLAVPWPPRGRCSASREVTFQPLEPIWLTDDFARLGRPGGPWTPAAGRWLCGGPPRPESRIPGFALRGWSGELRTGHWFWGDRAVELAVYPRSARTVRVDLARWDERHRLELSLPVGRGKGRLVRRHGRRTETVIGGVPHLAACQWNQLSLEVRQGKVAVAVDGRARRAALPEGGLGGLGLMADGGDAAFDDLRVSAPHESALLPLVHPARYDRGDDGLLDHDTWAHPAAAWLPSQVPGLRWHVGIFAGDLELRLPVRRRGRARLALYAARERGAAPLAVLDQRQLPDGATVMLARRSGRWLGRVGARPLPLQGQPAGAVCLGFQADGLQLDPAQVELRAADVKETVFDRAPTGWWQAEGDWSVNARWPCMPEWAWLSGSGRPRAVLWGKHRIKGDLVLEAWLGVRMVGQYASRRGEPFERLRLTIAGNGREPDSGYHLELGGAEGRSRLYRRGRLVASVARDLACPREVHNFWGGVRFERRGARLTAWYRNRPLLTYTDPEPLPDGQVALWTESNTLVTPYLAVYGRQEAGSRPLPGHLLRRQQEGQTRRPAVGFDPLPAIRALERLLGWEVGP